MIHSITKPIRVVKKGNGFSFYDSDSFLIGQIHHKNYVLWFKNSIFCDSKTYDIKNTGFLWNDFEVYEDEKLLYWSKFEKDQIRSKRNHFEIYKIKRGRTSRIFLEDELIFEVKVNKKWFKIEYEVNVKEDFSDNVLFILFFYFLTKEVNGIGGNYD